MHTMKLEIQFLSGDSEVRPLDPEQPVSIGRADSCDIQVDEEDVAQLHCRLLWNGSDWELKAANLDQATKMRPRGAVSKPISMRCRRIASMRATAASRRGWVAGIHPRGPDPTDRFGEGFRLDDGARVSGLRLKWERFRKTVEGACDGETGSLMRCVDANLPPLLPPHLPPHRPRVACAGTDRAPRRPHQDEG